MGWEWPNSISSFAFVSFDILTKYNIFVHLIFKNFLILFRSRGSVYCTACVVTAPNTILWKCICLSNKKGLELVITYHRSNIRSKWYRQGDVRDVTKFNF